MYRYTDDHDLHFIDAIRIHHTSVVALAEVAIDTARRAQVASLARQLITTAEQSIAQLESWREVWFADAPETDFRGIYDLSQITIDAGDLQQLAASPDFDLAFCQRLIPLNQAAIEMAETMLEVTDRPELQEFSNTLISTYGSAIEQVQALPPS